VTKSNAPGSIGRQEYQPGASQDSAYESELAINPSGKSVVQLAAKKTQSINSGYLANVLRSHRK
jgi:hypothetical protein